MLRRLHHYARKTMVEVYGVKVARSKLIWYGENATFRFWDERGQQYMFRFCRPGYQTEASLRSEVRWLRAIADEGVIKVPDPILARDGEALQTVEDGGFFPERHCLVFRWVGEGQMYDHWGPSHLRKVGRTTGYLHRQAIAFETACGLQVDRPLRSVEGTLGASGLFCDPLTVPELFGEARALFVEAREVSRAVLDPLMEDLESFGLIHTDLHRGNVLCHKNGANVIDFDDAARGYRLLDMAVVVRQARKEGHDHLLDAFLEGYGEMRNPDLLRTELLPLFEFIDWSTGLAWIQSRTDLKYLRKRIPFLIQGIAKSARVVLEGNFV